MKRITNLLIAVFVLLQVSVVAQTFDKDSPFQYVFDEKDDIHEFNYIAVNFVDTATKAVLNTFNIVENNPFNHLDYPEIEVTDPYHKNKEYLIKNTPINEIELLEGRVVIKKGVDTSGINCVNAYSYYQAFDLKDYLLIKYSLYVGVPDWVAGRSDAVFIFDAVGDLLYKLNDFDTDVREWALTENGRYFSYAHGGIQDESLEPFCDVGYKIIDLQTNEVTYEEYLGFKYNEVRTDSFKDLIVATGFSVDYLYVFIDLSKQTKYSRVFSNSELGLWKSTSDTGIFMYVGSRNSSEVKFLSFETDFKMGDLK